MYNVTSAVYLATSAINAPEQHGVISVKWTTMQLHTVTEEINQSTQVLQDLPIKKYSKSAYTTLRPAAQMTSCILRSNKTRKPRSENTE